MELFNKLLDYGEYLEENPFHESLGINLKDYGQLDKKIVRETYQSVDPENHIPFSTELDDLIRLHYLVTSRKVTTILEIGVGKSTVVFDHGIQKLYLFTFIKTRRPYIDFRYDIIYFINCKV